MDGNNQYIIIGRNPTGLLLSTDEIYELVNSFTEGITTFSLNREYTVDVQDYESLNSFSFFICSFHSSEEYGPSVSTQT